MGVLTDNVTELIVLSFAIVIVLVLVGFVLGFLDRFSGLNSGRRGR